MGHLARSILVVLTGGFGFVLVGRGLRMLDQSTNWQEFAFGMALGGTGLAIALAVILKSPATRRHEKAVKNVALSLALGYCGLFLLPEYVNSKMNFRHAKNVSNFKRLGTALAMYQSDHSERYPPAERWAESTAFYEADVDFYNGEPPEFPTCERSRSTYTYAMNVAISGVSATSIEDPSSSVGLFEMNAGVVSAFGTERDVENHHAGGSFFGMVDTSAKYSKSGLTFRWRP